MDSYIEITLLPDPEFPAPILMSAVYAKLHKRLFDMRSRHIGVSFPDAKQHLGDRLRIHGSNQDLMQFQSVEWLAGMRGFCSISNVLLISEPHQFINVSRWQPNMSQAKLRRLIKRGSISTNEQSTYVEKMMRCKYNTPFVELKSTTNGERYRRYFCIGKAQDQKVDGEFDAFGLSQSATVPLF